MKFSILSAGNFAVPQIRLLFLPLVFFVFCPLFADEGDIPLLSLGRFNMDFTSKQLDDGTQTDFMLGLFYTDAMKTAGEVRLRFINGAANDIIFDIDDSLMTRDRRIFEAFVLPFSYYFRLPALTFRAGAGLYYERNTLGEEGYFSDTVIGGSGLYHAYANDFKGNLVGPVIDAGVTGRMGIFYGAVSFGAVPVSYLLWDQTWRLSPMMTPPEYTVTSKNWTGPYFYLDLDLAVTVKFVSLFFSLLYEYSKLSYTAAGFDNLTGGWSDVEVTAKNKTLALEISLLLDFGNIGIMPQVGYGRTFNEAAGGKNYLLLGVKKHWL